MKNHTGLAVVIAAGLAAGCASTGYDASHPWEGGWRRGTIVEIGLGAALAGKVAEKCQGAALATSSNSRFATIGYRRDGYSIRHTVPVSGDLALNVGDAVYVNASECKVAALRPAGTSASTPAVRAANG